MMASRSARAALVLAAVAASYSVQAEPWRHAIASRSDAGFQVMAVRGAFSYKHGVDILLPVMQDDAAMLRALTAGEIESYEGDAAAAIIAAAQGADLKIVGCHWQAVVHGVFVRNELKSAADVKGTTMATSMPDATPDMVGKAWLAQNNIAPSDVKFASLGSDADRLKALQGKAAVAAAISIEYQPMAGKLGLKLMSRGSDVLPNRLRLCVVSSAKALQSRREDAIRFLAAQMQGLKFALANKDETVKLSRRVAAAKAGDPRPEFMFNEARNPKTGIDPSMPLDIDKLSWLQERLLEVGSLTQAYDLGRIVDREVREEALRRARL
jgi:NitT/TauT family transport system substrate-binding protein